MPESFLIKLQAKACNFIQKKTLVQVFPCEFSEIFKNTFLTEYLRATASVASLFLRFIPLMSQNDQIHFQSLAVFAARCCKVFKVCLTILECYASKGWVIFFSGDLPFLLQ